MKNTRKNGKKNNRMFIMEQTPEFKNGDKVKLSVDQITNDPTFGGKNEVYKKFIIDNRDTVFTVRLYSDGSDGGRVLVEFVENPTWLFWSGDLIKVGG